MGSLCHCSASSSLNCFKPACPARRVSVCDGPWNWCHCFAFVAIMGAQAHRSSSSAPRQQPLFDAMVAAVGGAHAPAAGATVGGHAGTAQARAVDWPFNWHRSAFDRLPELKDPYAFDVRNPAPDVTIGIWNPGSPDAWHGKASARCRSVAVQTGPDDCTPMASSGHVANDQLAVDVCFH